MNLDLPGWNVIKIEESDSDYRFTIRAASPSSSCPSCDTLHNLYRFGKRQKVFVDLPLFGKRVCLLVQRQRYQCKECSRTFIESLPNMDEKHAVTQRLMEYIKKESFRRSFVSIANDVGVSEGLIRQIFFEHITRQKDMDGSTKSSLWSAEQGTHHSIDIVGTMRRAYEMPRWWHGMQAGEEEKLLKIDASLEKGCIVAYQVADILSNHQAVTSVLVFGSLALGIVDEHSSVDVLVLCRSDIPLVHERRFLLFQIGRDWHFQDLSNQEPLFAEIDTNGTVDGVLVTIYYQTTSWMTKTLKKVLHDDTIPINIMPYYTLLGLLHRGWLLLDKRRDVKKWRTQLLAFPKKSKVNLIQYLTPILRKNVKELIVNAEQKLGPRAFLFHLNLAVDALIGILFALNEAYSTTDWQTEQIILSTLEKVPRDILPTLKEVLEGPFDDKGALYRAQLLQQLTSEVLEMAEMEIV